MEYVRVTVLGHTPVEVWLTNVKLPAFSPAIIRCRASGSRELGKAGVN